jgi:uncharacterized repeat protein (TIGR01451 family)
MNTSIQHSGPNGIVQPSGDSSRSGATLSAWRKLPGRFTFTALLAGLFLLLFRAPATAATLPGTPPGCGGSGLGIALGTPSGDSHVGCPICYSVTVYNGGVGPITYCDASNIVAFIVTPDTNKIFIPLAALTTAAWEGGTAHTGRTLLRNGQYDYYTNVACYYIRTNDIRPDGTVRATAQDIGIILQNDTPSASTNEQGVNTEVSLPGLNIAVSCTNSVGENGAITFSGTVTNTGNSMLFNVTVFSSLTIPNLVATFPTLDVGQVASFSGFWVPLNPCSLSTNTFVAQGTDSFVNCPPPGGQPTATTNAICSNTLTPGIKVTKTCSGNPVPPGFPLTFSGSVSNTGNVTLTNIVVVNSQPTNNTVITNFASLPPFAVSNFTSSYPAPTNCSVTDTLIARASSVCGVPVSSTNSATCTILTTPQITVTAPCPTNQVVPLGSLIYSVTVSNTGYFILTNISVFSDQPGLPNPVKIVASLAPGASTNFNVGPYSVPANACWVSNTFSATGKDLCTSTTATNTASTTICQVITAPGIGVTLACPVPPATTGGLITYTGTVTNSGNVTLINVYVVNNQPSNNTPVTGPLIMLPHQSMIFYATFTAPTNACSVSSTVTATGSDNCTGNPVTTTASAGPCPLNTTPLLVITQNCPPTYQVSPGGGLYYSGTVSNAGNITITNVVVLNNLSGATPVLTNATLAPGAVTNFNGNYIAPTNCSTTSISTVTGRSICGVAVTNTVSSTCPISTAPAIVVTALCPTNPVVPNGSLTYSVMVTNTGNITLTNVVVFSDRSVPNTVLTLASLAPGASTNFPVGPYTVPANACAVTTTFSVTGTDCNSTIATNNFTRTCTVITAPAIAVTLACPATNAVTGGPITYTGTVTNSGNVTLNNVTVIDSQSGTVLTVPSLAPHASANFTASFTAPTNACSVSSTVTASGSDNCYPQVIVTTNASATCPLITTPGITVTKRCPDGRVAPGQPFIFTGSVSNSGNITLNNIFVVNNQPSNNTPVFYLASLAPGAVVSFNNRTNSYPAPTNCSVTDTLTVRATSICGMAVTNYGSNTCTIFTTPAIEVTVSCPTNPVGQGGLLTYSGTVSNAGNITLTNIVVTNNWPYIYSIYVTASLAPGATTNFTGSYYVPSNCCVAWLWVVASGQGCDGVTVTDTNSLTCAVFTSPGIVVTKVCATRRRPLRPGDILTYSGSVSNTGNITLYNVTVVDNQPFPGSPVLGPNILAPGEFATFAGSYVVPVDFCGNDTVTASGFDLCSGALVTNSVTAICPIAHNPRIGVTKQCPPRPTQHGGTLWFTGTVTNLGDVTLVNVYVVNDQPSNNTPVIGPITLSPGAGTNFTGSYTAPLVCCEIIDTLTARGQDHCSFSNVTATATAICPTLYTPGIALVPDQPCPPNLLPGTCYCFSGYVINTGDAILTNASVFSSALPCQPQDGNQLQSLAPIDGQQLFSFGLQDLSPGQAEPYYGCLIVPSNICEVTISVTSQETCEGTLIANTISCPVTTTPCIYITENCPTGPVTNGTYVTFGGSVCNCGNITETNVWVFSGQNVQTFALIGSHDSPDDIIASPRISVLGPITLDPGVCSNFTVSYYATGGNLTTNSIIVTNLPGTIITNVVSVIATNNTFTATPNTPMWFGTINSVLGTYTNRFLIGSNFNGLTYDASANGYEAMDFYSIRSDTTNASWYDSINSSIGLVLDRFAVPTIGNTNLTYDALTYAADSVGYGPLLFYYLSHDNAGVTWFGTITVGGVVGVTANLFPVGTNVTFDVLTYTATDVGYGAELFYYIRHDTNGISWFGTINPALPGTITDRFAVGTNTTFVGLVFTPLGSPGYGLDNFYYLRQNPTNGVTTFGTLYLPDPLYPPYPPTNVVVIDRFTVGTNATELTFTHDNAGAFGADLFYYFSGSGGIVTTYTTNYYTNTTSYTYTTYTTNIVVSLTTTNTVTAYGWSICQPNGQPVTAAANCSGSIGTVVLVIGTPTVNSDGFFGLTFPTVAGTLYWVQYKDTLLDSAWTNLPGMPVTGTGAPWTSYDSDPAALHPSRFYRIMSFP